MEFNAAPPQFNGPLAQFSDLKVQSDQRVDDKVQGSRFKVQGQSGFELRRSRVEH